MFFDWLKRVEHKIDHLLRLLEELFCHRALRAIFIIQVEGEMPTDFSIQAGQNGQFAALLIPGNGTQEPGTVPQWSASDTNVIVTPAPDGLTCEVAVPIEFAGASFDLSISAQSSDSAIGTVSGKHTISVSQPPPPPPPALSGIDFVQTS